MRDDEKNEISEDLLRMLQDPLFWEPPSLISDDEIRELFARAAAEKAEAASLCDLVLTGPSWAWPERMRVIPGVRSVAVVLELLQRVPELLERRPEDAPELTSLALAIAEVLDPRENPVDHVDFARGLAERDHAYVLSCLGRHREALRFAERTFAAAGPGADEFDLEPLEVVRERARRSGGFREGG